MTLPDPYPIVPLSGPFDVAIDDLPGSKSLTNRALLIAALAKGKSTLSNILFADDTRVMIKALQDLGFELNVDEQNKTVTVHGCGGEIPAKQAELFLGNAGTAMRFLTAACCLGNGTYTLTGIERMHERPIGQLVEPLRQLGANIEYLGKEGYPPLRITADGLAGGEIEIDPSTSSQFVSALMQVGCYCKEQLKIVFSGDPVSKPYIIMTGKLMEQFGVHLGDAEGLWKNLSVRQNKYCAKKYCVEADASNTSYFLAAAAIMQDSSVCVKGLGFRSIQGDKDFAGQCLENMGANVIVTIDSIEIETFGSPQLIGTNRPLNDMPDMAQTLAVVALFADGPTTIRDVGNLRVKETDRLAALKNELEKLGAKVTITGDDIKIVPPKDNILRHPNGTVIDEDHPVEIDTYDDHRMAMSFAVAGLRQSGIRIKDPSCVNKTFPQFWDYLERLRQ